MRSGPPAVVEAHPLPIPRVGRSINPLAWAGGPISVHIPTHLDGDGPITGVVPHFPLLTGVYDALCCRIALQQEGSAGGILRHRGKLGKVPDHSCDHVVSGTELRCNIHTLKAPMPQICAGWSPSDPGAVHKELVALVGSDVDHKAGRLLAKVKTPSEMVDAKCVGGSVGSVRRIGMMAVRNPARRPAIAQQFRVNRGRPSPRGGCQKQKCGERGNETKPAGKLHGTRPFARNQFTCCQVRCRSLSYPSTNW